MGGSNSNTHHASLTSIAGDWHFIGSWRWHHHTNVSLQKHYIMTCCFLYCLVCFIWLWQQKQEFNSTSIHLVKTKYSFLRDGNPTMTLIWLNVAIFREFNKFHIFNYGRKKSLAYFDIKICSGKYAYHSENHLTTDLPHRKLIIPRYLSK